MKRYNLAYLVAVMTILVIFTGQTLAQDVKEDAIAKPAPVAAAAAPAQEKAAQPEELSIYGEVLTVNPAVSSLSVQYYSYDTDEEKTIEITSDSSTKIENAASLADIKQNDWVDATYSISGGKNVAKSIKVEKDEEEISAPTPVEELPAPEEEY